MPPPLRRIMAIFTFNIDFPFDLVCIKGFRDDHLNEYLFICALPRVRICVVFNTWMGRGGGSGGQGIFQLKSIFVKTNLVAITILCER